MSVQYKYEKCIAQVFFYNKDNIYVVESIILKLSGKLQIHLTRILEQFIFRIYIMTTYIRIFYTIKYKYNMYFCFYLYIIVLV